MALPLPKFSAGSHIDVYIRPTLSRQYSLCNDPSEQHRYLIAVLREPNSRGGSIAMHDEIHEGDLVTISAPRNHFPLVEARRSLLFAGGIGITPILCMAEGLAQTDAQFEMHYCARSESRAAFRTRIG
jgi:Flavodoxin reductases (ferredoxin-NADPH reductases) family 1